MRIPQEQAKYVNIPEQLHNFDSNYTFDRIGGHLEAGMGRYLGTFQIGVCRHFYSLEHKHVALVSSSITTQFHLSFCFLVLIEGFKNIFNIYKYFILS